MRLQTTKVWLWKPKLTDLFLNPNRCWTAEKRSTRSLCAGNELRAGCHVGALDRKSCKNKWRERRRSRARNEESLSHKLSSSIAWHQIIVLLSAAVKQQFFYRHVGGKVEEVIWSQMRHFKFIMFSQSHILVTFSAVNPFFLLQSDIFFHVAKKITGMQRVQSSPCRSQRVKEYRRVTMTRICKEDLSRAGKLVNKIPHWSKKTNKKSSWKIHFKCL